MTDFTRAILTPRIKVGREVVQKAQTKEQVKRVYNCAASVKMWNGSNVAQICDETEKKSCVIVIMEERSLLLIQYFSPYRLILPLKR